jgi:hypothetical protein
MRLTFEELLEYFKVSESTINTNFPLFCSKQLQKGYKITKFGKGKTAIFEVEKVEPQTVDKNCLSSRPAVKSEDLPNEVWVQTYCNNNFEVSNLGRFRHKKTKTLLNGTNKKGYMYYSFDDKNYSGHRVVIQSFSPREDFEDMTVDHKNGIRTDNRLENLEWVAGEENVRRMLANRADLNIELTRLIQKWGYEETLNKLKSM